MPESLLPSHDHDVPWPPAPTNRPAKIAWLMPSLIEGSGGHRTILQNARALIDRGHECHLFIEQASAPDHATTQEELARAREQLLMYFGYDDPNIHLGFEVPGTFNLVFATAWYTAPYAAWSPVACKAYFVQDFEAMFMPMGDGYLMAENSYRLGLTPITIGRWLTHKLSAEFSAFGSYFDFCADHDVYRPLGSIPRERAVCMICQPEKPRRCSRIGIEALGIVKHHRPDVKILLYGSKERPDVWYDHEWHGLLDVRGCNEVYNRSSVGLCISSSNPSRIPFEMMSSGLPVVDIHRENNLYDQPDAAVLLAGPRPEDIAAAIIELLDDEPRRGAMSANGLSFMARRSLEYGYTQFIEAVETLLEGRESEFVAVSRGLRPSYHRAAIIGGPGPAQPRSIVEDGARAAWLAALEARQVLAASIELDSILNSRTWRLFDGLKRMPPFSILARMRWGPDWQRADPHEDPRSRLHRVRTSRTYRFIAASKATPLYRWYSARRHADRTSP
ncbi:MAG: glycosyltransferase family 4 protein [Phycisphaeraceae bacterium]|nr:glycosyltransferase family 4 protein [Phycisphaerae bacterium]MBX3391494.1 glycosyltransferase family 4 protein [Phycisphaeraceae bacterium]